MIDADLMKLIEQRVEVGRHQGFAAAGQVLLNAGYTEAAQYLLLQFNRATAKLPVDVADQKSAAKETLRPALSLVTNSKTRPPDESI